MDETHLSIGLFQKNSKQGGWWMYYSEIPPSGIFRFVTLSLEIPEKTSFHLLEILQNCVPRLGNLKVKNQDPRKFTLVFLYKTPINSTSFLIGPWNFHVSFLQYPWSGNSMYSTLGPCLDSFWNSPLLEMSSVKKQQKCSVIWSMSIDNKGLENQYHKISSLEFVG